MIEKISVFKTFYNWYIKKKERKRKKDGNRQNSQFPVQTANELLIMQVKERPSQSCSKPKFLIIKFTGWKDKITNKNYILSSFFSIVINTYSFLDIFWIYKIWKKK